MAHDKHAQSIQETQTAVESVYISRLHCTKTARMLDTENCLQNHINAKTAKFLSHFQRTHLQSFIFLRLLV